MQPIPIQTPVVLTVQPAPPPRIIPIDVANQNNQLGQPAPPLIPPIPIDASRTIITLTPPLPIDASRTMPTLTPPLPIDAYRTIPTLSPIIPIYGDSTSYQHPIMQQTIPVAVAVEMVWRPTTWTIEIGWEQGTAEHQDIINAEWKPSTDWSQLGHRLKIFFDTWRPEKSNEFHVVSLIVGTFGTNFANSPHPNTDSELNLKQALRKRYIVSTPCERVMCAPGFGGDYNSGTQGICEWWTKVLSLVVILFSLIGVLLLRQTASNRQNPIYYNANQQQVELYESLGFLAIVIACLLSLPALWVVFIQLIHTFSFLVACICCCTCMGSDFLHSCCDCCDWLPCCGRGIWSYCFSTGGRGRQSAQVQPITGEVLEQEHKRRKRANIKNVSGWNNYNK